LKKNTEEKKVNSATMLHFLKRDENNDNCRPSVNFINVLCTAFALVDPESVRTQSSCQYLFTLLGSTHIKAVRRMLMKSTPRREKNVFKIFQILFWLERIHPCAKAIAS
jgi:hypothetical protein